MAFNYDKKSSKTNQNSEIKWSSSVTEKCFSPELLLSELFKQRFPCKCYVSLKKLKVKALAFFFSLDSYSALDKSFKLCVYVCVYVCACVDRLNRCGRGSARGAESQWRPSNYGSPPPFWIYNGFCCHFTERQVCARMCTCMSVYMQMQTVTLREYVLLKDISPHPHVFAVMRLSLCFNS